MCLITKKKKVSIAKRDKTVIKWIKERYFIDDNPDLWCGPIFNDALFPFNEIVTARDYSGKEIDHLRICGDWNNKRSYKCISEGIHSYRIYSLINYFDRYQKICVIPKGSEYCYGGDGEAVSTKIIVFSSYKKYFQYKWKKLLEKIS